MKTKIIQIIGISFFAFTIFNSCSRERIEPTEQMNSYESINDYFDTKKEDEQEFIIDSEGNGPIIGRDSTKLWISKEILMFPDGSDVEWPFTVRLVELYSPKDMIYYQMPTVAGVKVMETEGEIRVRAFKNDTGGNEQELVLKPNKTFAIEMPSDSIRDNLKVHYGKDANGYTDWTTSTTAVGGNPADLYFDETANGHSANVGKLGWINCGAPHLGFNSLSFTSEVDELNNVGIFVYVPKYKSVIQARNQSTEGAGVEDSTQAKIIAIGINSNDELFYQYMSASIYESGSIPITLQAITEAELTNILDNL